MRRFLFVDRYHGHKLQYRDEYIQQINVSLAIPIAALFNFFPFHFMIVSFMFVPDSSNTLLAEYILISFPFLIHVLNVSGEVVLGDNEVSVQMQIRCEFTY
ncbi:hypothetical protein PRUPE_5G154300 [Prunus persica]|uniref:Uncharacterized protein n=1 Tax=Prunus persica TaxID=3760 RepID=A0A251P920_PRUPE|nr:hypothetical protein PRUPE_5G154300 [Prunus persica]